MKFKVAENRTRVTTLHVCDMEDGAIFMIEGKAGLFVKANYATMFRNSKMLTDITNRGDCLLFELNTNTLSYSPASSVVVRVFRQEEEIELKTIYKRGDGWIS